MSRDKLKFIMFGVGFVAERHLKAIKDLGHELIGVLDPHDGVGILDRYFPNALYFREPERFDRWLYSRSFDGSGPDWAAVCSPNWLHDAHCRMAMRAGADVICEKPVVINPKNVVALQDAEGDYGQNVHVVHQLRHHLDIVTLKAMEMNSPHEETDPADVELTYCAPRGPWYAMSWKGDERRSGGIIMNLGIHFLDALCWIYGHPRRVDVHHRDEDRISGFIDFDRAHVRWFLSTDPRDSADGQPDRSMRVDGKRAFDFNRKFSDLHRRVYEAAIEGEVGYDIGLDDALPALELARTIRLTEVNLPLLGFRDNMHDKLTEIIE